MTPVLDVYDPGFLRDPYPAFDRVREETPVFRAPGRKGERPVWFLTRHADVRRALRDRRLGRIDQPTVDRTEWGLPPLRDDLSPYYDVEHWALVWLEPPNHTKIRRLVSRAFTLRRVASLRPRISVLADRLLDPILERGRMDLVNDYAAPFSVQVIAELLGVPTTHWRRMLDWSSRITRMYEYNTDAAQTRSAVDACIEFSEYCEDLMARRRAEPRDDLITALCFAETEDGTLTDVQIVSMIITLLNAGHEASVNTLANGMLALMHHPDQWRLLTRGEVDPATAVEELFRWDAPIQTFDRWVVAEPLRGWRAGHRAVRTGDRAARKRQPRSTPLRRSRLVLDRPGRPDPRQLRRGHPPLPRRALGPARSGGGPRTARNAVAETATRPGPGPAPEVRAARLQLPGTHGYLTKNSPMPDNRPLG